jgi:hypothetical protein
MTQNSDFLSALRLGQQKLLQGSTTHNEIVGVLDRFGAALHDYTEGRLGVGCVTAEGHEPVDGYFQVGSPMSIVVVLHEDKNRPIPIVGGFSVPVAGFPVQVSFGERVYTANDEAELENAFMALAASRELAAAVNELLGVNAKH